MEKLRMKPLVVKKSNIAYIKTYNKGAKPVKFQTVFKEDVLCDTKDFVNGDFQRLQLVNRLNIVTKVIITVARYFSKDGTILEKTSDQVASIIGQENYKTVFSGLCSVLDQNLKIRSILALLTKSGSGVCEGKKSDSKLECMNKFCQTDEIRINVRNPRRRIRKKQGPYIVKEGPEEKKVVRKVINIPNLKQFDNVGNLINITNKNVRPNTNTCITENPDNSTDNHIKSTGTVSESNFPEIILHEDYSNDSLNFSVLSVDTTPELLNNPLSMLMNVEKHTKDIEGEYIVQPSYMIKVMDGTTVKHITIPTKPEDDLHIATPDNLKYLDNYNRKLLIKHQMGLDLKHCLTVLDEDGNLPIHVAVLNDDVELVRRQCIVLRIKNKSVDIPANGLSPLKLSLYQEPSSTSILLKFGADILQVDADHRTPIHIAAQLETDHLAVLLNNCRTHARRILSESDVWREELQNMSEDELVEHLLKHVCTVADRQGYNPLMLASIKGMYTNVRLLLEHTSEIINYQMPTSGNTALYLACDAACYNCTEHGNKSKVQDCFQKTIETLLDYGADPALENYSGSSVNTLLTEFNSGALSQLISNKLTKCNFQKNKILVGKDNKFDNVMLVKNDKGTVDVQTLRNERKEKHKQEKNEIKEKQIPEKPVILQNLLLRKPMNRKSTKKESISNESRPITTESAAKVTDVKNIVIVPGSEKSLKRKMPVPGNPIKAKK